MLKDADYVFLGTKPHDFEALAERIKDDITEDKCFISIMAGLSIDYIREQLNTNNPLARIMPNTNAQLVIQLQVLVSLTTLVLNQRRSE